MKELSQEDFKRFDLTKKTTRQKGYLRPLIWLLSYPDVWKQKSKIKRINTEKLRPPYLLLCNHNSFFDFKVTTVAIKMAKASYVVAVDGFIGREWLLRSAGGIAKRKFTTDTSLIRHLRDSAKRGDVVVLYPEARYSLCGTNSVLPESLGKLVKLLKIPVVTLIMNGNHIKSPFWNTRERGNRTEATLTQIITSEEIKNMSYQEINKRINEKFIYDDFAWQKKNSIKIDKPYRAAGLHKVLYQCPHCMKEYHMMSEGIKIWCNDCKKEWEMTEYGELKACHGKTEFTHIPDWYEWERNQVRKEIEEGRYKFFSKATVQSLPNSKGYISLGEATLIHDITGFTLEGEYRGEPYRVEINSRSLYSCHIEYEYLGKYGDCVDLNTLDDTYYIYPKDCDFSVTKLSLATEEIYKWIHKHDEEKCPNK